MPDLPLAGRRMVLGIRDQSARWYDVAIYDDGVSRVKHLIATDRWQVLALAELLGCLVQLPPRALDEYMYVELLNLLIRFDIPVVGRC